MLHLPCELNFFEKEQHDYGLGDGTSVRSEIKPIISLGLNQTINGSLGSGKILLNLN